MLHSRTFKVVLAICLVVVLAGATTAFAAGVTFNQPNGVDFNAGQGGITTNGYNVDNFEFVNDDSDPTKLQSVSLTLDSAASNVQVKLATGGSYLPCSTSDPNKLIWTCATTIMIKDIDMINVIAVNQN